MGCKVVDTKMDSEDLTGGIKEWTGNTSAQNKRSERYQPLSLFSSSSVLPIPKTSDSGPTSIASIATCQEMNK